MRTASFVAAVRMGSCLERMVVDVRPAAATAGRVDAPRTVCRSRVGRIMEAISIDQSGGRECRRRVREEAMVVGWTGLIR